MQTSKYEDVINQVVDGQLVVSITKQGRVRICGLDKPIEKFARFRDDLFLPGRVLSPEESKPYLKKLGRME